MANITDSVDAEQVFSHSFGIIIIIITELKKTMEQEGNGDNNYNPKMPGKDTG